MSPSLRDFVDFFLWLAGKIGIGWTASFVLAILAVWLWLSKRKMARLFPNRADLNKATKGLANELEKATAAWIVWPTGGTSVALSDQTLARIERLVLLDPQTDSDAYARNFSTGGPEIVASSVHDLSQRAIKAGVEVRWTSGPLVSIVIHNHISDKAWARMELLLPGIEAAYRPSIKIAKKNHSDLFQVLVKMYEGIWNESKKPSQAAP